MFLTRACPRCRGDLYQDQDLEGYFLSCLQCGQEIQLSRKLSSGERLSSDVLDRVHAAVTRELVTPRMIPEGDQAVI